MTLPFVIQHHSNYGTSTPAVARTVLQARDIFNACHLSEPVKEQALKHLFDVQEQLVRCVEVRDRLQAEVTSLRSGFDPRVAFSGKALRAPGVADLRGRAETFLQAAKFAIRDTGFAAGSLFAERDAKLRHYGHRFHKLQRWCLENLGPDYALTKILLHCQSFVQDILALRDAVDHPKDGIGGHLVVRNFQVTTTAVGVMLSDPTWGLHGHQMVDILRSMNTIIDSIIEVQEDVVVGLFETFKAPIFALAEIPEAERDPANPRRFRVGLTPEAAARLPSG